MDVLDLLQKIENHLLSKANNNKDRHSLEKIYHILEIIDKSISGFADDDKTVTETFSFDELLQSFDYQAKQNYKDAKKERIRIPTRVPRDVAKDGNHPLLGELYSTLRQIRQEQRQQQETQIRTDTKSYRVIARCVSQYSHSCPHHPYKKTCLKTPYKSIQDLLSVVRFLIKPLHDLTYTTYYIQFPRLCLKQLRGSVEERQNAGSNNSSDQLIRSLDIIDGRKGSKNTRHELKDLTIESY
jgi:hypothetical protein